MERLLKTALHDYVLFRVFVFLTKWTLAPLILLACLYSPTAGLYAFGAALALALIAGVIAVIAFVGRYL